MRTVRGQSGTGTSSSKAAQEPSEGSIQYCCYLPPPCLIYVVTFLYLVHNLVQVIDNLVTENVELQQ